MSECRKYNGITNLERHPLKTIHRLPEGLEEKVTSHLCAWELDIGKSEGGEQASDHKHQDFASPFSAAGF